MNEEKDSIINYLWFIPMVIAMGLLPFVSAIFETL